MKKVEDWEYRRDAVDFALRMWTPGMTALDLIRKAELILRFLEGEKMA